MHTAGDSQRDAAGSPCERRAVRSPSAAFAARFTAPWCALQSLGIVVWWLALWLHPPLRVHFLFEGAPPSTLFAFLLPDAVVCVALGTAAAVGARRRRPWTRAVLLVTTGGVVYAALYAIALALLGGRALGAALMAPSLVVMPWLSFAGERCD
jgi:hypothetical protein